MFGPGSGNAEQCYFVSRRNGNPSPIGGDVEVVIVTDQTFAPGWAWNYGTVRSVARAVRPWVRGKDSRKGGNAELFQNAILGLALIDLRSGPSR